MTKRMQTKKEKANYYKIKHINEFVVGIDGDLCSCIIDCMRKLSVDMHRNTKKHKEELEFREKSLQQTFLVNEDTYKLNAILLAFLSANIPSYKLTHPVIKNMFRRFGRVLPYLHS